MINISKSYQIVFFLSVLILSTNIYFLGVVNLITANIVKPGACVIDVGIVRIPTENGKTKIVGDVDFDGEFKNLIIINTFTNISNH